MPSRVDGHVTGIMQRYFKSRSGIRKLKKKVPEHHYRSVISEMRNDAMMEIEDLKDEYYGYDHFDDHAMDSAQKALKMAR